MLNIKDTESYEIGFYQQTTPNHNRTKLKSRFNQSNDDYLQNIRTKFDSTDRKPSSNDGSAIKKEFTTPERFWKGKDFLATDSEQSYLQSFHFPIKIKKDLLKKKYIAPWKELERKGVGIHVGEWGAFQHTPHATALKWMEDNLQLWKEAGWGWSLWNLRGSFGILDSGRKDVVYEDWHGSKLDRKMLELLRRY